MEHVIFWLCITGYMLFIAMVLLFARYRLQRWQQTFADINKIYYEEEFDSNELNDNVVNKYYLKAEYQYRVNGLNYSGKKVGVYDIFKFIPSYDTQLYRSLLAHFEDKKPIKIYYHPKKHHKSFIRRDFYSIQYFCLLAMLALSAVITFLSYEKNIIQYDLIGVICLVAVFLLMVFDIAKLIKLVT